MGTKKVGSVTALIDLGINAFVLLCAYVIGFRAMFHGEWETVMFAFILVHVAEPNIVRKIKSYEEEYHGVESQSS